VKSPAAAVILSRTINPGEITKLDQEIFQLGTIENVMMVAEVSEDKIGFVHLGMRSEIGTDAFPGETFKGEVVKVEARVSPLTRTFGVYIRIENTSLRLKPGVTGYARLLATHTSLTITSTALINPVEDRATVFVVDKNDVAHIRQVRRGLMAEGMTEILDGLQEGERVVTVGQLELRDNDHVHPNAFGPWNGKK
jgi:membrane fusion protein (multidrug efflux system)